MSASLVKKSLELFKDDIEDEKVKKKKAKKPMQLIGTSRKGVQKRLKQLKKREEIERQTKLKKKRLKSALEDVAQHKAVDQTAQNLVLMEQLMQLGAVSSSSSEKILKHNHGRLARSQTPPKEEEEEPYSILFADREFDKKKPKETFWDSD